MYLSQKAQEFGRKISNVLARGVVKLVKSSLKTQQLQVSLLADETRSDIEHPQEYGFTSYPIEGAEAIAGFIGGNRDHGTILCVFDKRYRPTDLASGEVCIYDHLGTRITLKSGNKIEIIASTEIDIISPLVKITGDLQVTGDITDRTGSNADTIHGMRQIYNSHTHPDPQGSNTSPPTQQM